MQIAGASSGLVVMLESWWFGPGRSDSDATHQMKTLSRWNILLRGILQDFGLRIGRYSLHVHTEKERRCEGNLITIHEGFPQRFQLLGKVMLPFHALLASD